MKDVFILNPVAGNGFAVATMEKLEAVLKEKKREYQVCRTERVSHATELARGLSQDQNVRAVVSVGGDGTAFEVAGGLTGTGKAMGIIPAGTGNDFIKSAGIPKDPLQALEVILTREAAPVDMGSLNEGSFLNVCGTGFDVSVLDHAESLKQKYRGLLPYLLGLFKAIAHYRPVHLKIRADGQEEEGDYLICTVANGRYIGGGIPICPVAQVADGKLDLVLVQDIPRRRIPLYVPALMMGRLLNCKITRHRLVDEISFEGKDLRVNVDGGIFSMNRASFAIRPGVLQLIR